MTGGYCWDKKIILVLCLQLITYDLLWKYYRYSTSQLKKKKKVKFQRHLEILGNILENWRKKIQEFWKTFFKNGKFHVFWKIIFNRSISHLILKNYFQGNILWLVKKQNFGENLMIPWKAIFRCELPGLIKKKNFRCKSQGCLKNNFPWALRNVILKNTGTFRGFWAKYFQGNEIPWI